MARDEADLWDALARSGEHVATEEEYEHGYSREVRRDLRQYVAFWAAGEYYGLAIDHVVEISKLFETTPVPHTAAFVQGIGSVRGNVITVIDLPTRLRLSRTGLSRDTRILVVRHGEDLFGVIVDSMAGVVSIAPEELEEAPGAFAGTRADFIQTLARHGQEILIILNLDAVLDPRDFVDQARREQWA